MKSNHGWYYSTQISLRKNHWRNPEPHSNKFLSVTFLNRVHVSFELDSELDAAKSFVNADECERIVFQDYYWDRNVRENSYRCEFQYRYDFLISYRVYMMIGSFHISLFEGTLHVDKIHVWFKIANITHALPVPVYRQTDFHTETFGRFAFTLYRCEISYRSKILFPLYNNRGEPTRGDSRRHDVLWWYHVNKCRAMSWEGTGVNSLWCEIRPGVM